MGGFFVPIFEVGPITELPNGRFACCLAVFVLVVQARPSCLFAAFFEGSQYRFCGHNDKLMVVSKRV
jgi:hypothetical protein